MTKAMTAVDTDRTAAASAGFLHRIRQFQERYYKYRDPRDNLCAEIVRDRVTKKKRACRRTANMDAYCTQHAGILTGG